MRAEIFLFSAIIAMLIIGGAFALPQEARPETGTIIKGGEGNGLCKLDVINDATVDAAAYLCNMNKEVLVAVYIRSGEYFNLTGIDAGSYELYFLQGRDWNATAGRFKNDSHSSRMDGPLEFETLQTPEGVRYTWGEVTLKEVVGGEANMVPVSEEDFPI